MKTILRTISAMHTILSKLPYLCWLVILALSAPFANGQCIQANSNTTLTLPFLSSVTNPANAYDLNDGDITTRANLTVNGIGLATLNVNFDKIANPGDSIIVFFGVPTVNLIDWGSLGSVTFTPFSGINGTGTASTGLAAGNIAFILSVGTASLARIAIPVTSLSGAQSLQTTYLGIGAVLGKTVYVYDVAVKPGPVVVSQNQTICPGGTATFTASYNAVNTTPIDVIWYGSDGTTVLQTDNNHTGAPYVSTFTTPVVTSNTTFYVRERWTGCTLLSDPKMVTVNVRPPLLPDINISCGPPASLSSTTPVTSPTAILAYNWTASNGGNIVSGANSAGPVIDHAGDYQVTVTDNNGCTGTKTESFSSLDCAALPVTLISFDARKEGAIVLLEWRTTFETNSDRFEVERSIDGKKWSIVGSVAASKESTTLTTYQFMDLVVALGENLYRLKMIDKDGTFAYSRIRSIESDAPKNLAVYPNPVSEILYLKDTDISKINAVSIYNSNGQSVFTSNSVSSSGINVKNLPDGIYTVKVLVVDRISVHKILISK